MAAQKQKKNRTASGDSGKNNKGGVPLDEPKASWSIAGITVFYQEVLAEFDNSGPSKKMQWPNKKVTAGLTCFVLVLVVFISIFLGSVDLILGKLVTAILNFGMM